MLVDFNEHQLNWIEELVKMELSTRGDDYKKFYTYDLEAFEDILKKIEKVREDNK